MKHQVITLPEHHEHYPHLWQSECGTYRIIRCCDDIQYIFQRWREPKWRSLSYHVEYDSLVRRWGGMLICPHSHLRWSVEVFSSFSMVASPP